MSPSCADLRKRSIAFCERKWTSWCSATDMSRVRGVADTVLSRSAKATYYVLASPLMRLNGLLYRHLRSPRHGLARVHLGPGREKYLRGWINVDANLFTAKCDVWADLRHPLPFRDSTVDAFYSHHV